VIGALVKSYWLQLLVVALIGVLAFFVNHYRDNAITYKDQRDKVIKELTGERHIKDMQTRQRDVASLDAKYTRELADAKAAVISLSAMLLLAASVALKLSREWATAPAARAMLPSRTY
jgi:prophage endopeptidase